MTSDELLGVLRALPEAALIVTRDGAVFAANRGARRALGVSADPRDCLHLSERVERPQEFERYLESCARSLDPLPGAFSLKQEGAPPRRFRCEGARLNVPLQGARSPVLLRFWPKDEPNQFVVLNEKIEQLTSEIRKRQDVEAALRESEERFRYLAEMLPQLVWMTQPDGRPEYLNRRWIEYTGVDVDRAGDTWAALIHPDDRDEALAAWRHSLMTGAPYQQQFRMRRASDGTYHWFLDRAIPARNAAGRIVRWFGTCTDIHEQKQAEQDAVAAISVRDDFLSMAAHELKTPLTSLKLQLDLLSRALNRIDGEVRRGLDSKVQAAHRQISRLNALNDSLLDVSRIRSGRLSLEYQFIDLSQLVREGIERLESVLTRAGCPLRVELQPEVSGWWDPLRLDQVLVNLLTNAAKYGRGKPIEVSLSAAAGWASLSVRDHGIGIAPDAAARIFQKFERAVAAEHYGGLGLGLYIANQIVQAMGGVIRVESNPGAGATFTVTLPQARPEEAPAVHSQTGNGSADPAGLS